MKMTQQRRRFVGCVLQILRNYPFIIAFLCYIPSVVLPSDSPWIYDDYAAITDNPCIRGNDASGKTAPWSCLLTVDYWGTPMQEKRSHKSFRPVTSLLFRLEQLLWGIKDARPWHFLNAALHGICSQLVLQLARSLMPTEPATVHQIVGILFAVHPIHTDCVSNVTGRCEVLSAIFMLLAYFVAQKLSTALALPTGLLLVVLATLSKEQGFTVVGIILAYLVCCEIQHLKLSNAFLYSKQNSWLGMMRNIRVSTLAKLTLWLLGGVFLFWCRLKIQVESPTYSAWQNPAAFHSSSLVRFLSRIHLVYYHASLLVWPVLLCPDYSNGAVPLVQSFLDQRMLVPYLWVIISFIGAIFAIRHSLGSEINATPIIMSVTWLIFPFIPASNILFPVGFTVAERILYSPSIGFCLLVGLLCGVFIRWSRKYQQIQSWGRWALCFILIIFGVRTMLRDMDWSSGKTMWEISSSSCPPNAINYGNHANELMNTHQYQEAEMMMKKAIAIPLPIPNPMMELKLASLYILQTRFEEARRICSRFNNVFSTYCMAQADEKEGKWESAVGGYEFILNQNLTPSQYKFERVDHWAVRMNHLYCTLEHDKLKQNTTRTIQLAQSIQNDTEWKMRSGEESFVQEKLGEAYGLQGKWDLMETALSMSIAFSPTESRYFRRSLQVYMELGRYDMGCEFLRRYRQQYDHLDNDTLRMIGLYGNWQYLKKRDAPEFTENEKVLQERLKSIEGGRKAEILLLFEIIGENIQNNISIHSILFLRKYLEEIRPAIMSNETIGIIKTILMDLKDGDHHDVLTFSKMTRDGIHAVNSTAERVKSALETIEKTENKNNDTKLEPEQKNSSTIRMNSKSINVSGHGVKN